MCVMKKGKGMGLIQGKMQPEGGSNLKKARGKGGNLVTKNAQETRIEPTRREERAVKEQKHNHPWGKKWRAELRGRGIKKWRGLYLL